MIITQRQGIQETGLAMLIEDMPCDVVMAEIGCYAGESAQMFVDSGKVIMIYCIDPWISTGEAEIVFDGIISSKLVKCKGTIDDFIDKLPMLDIVYIDGDHSYAAVKNDITKAMRKIKPGGIIAGHDYGPGYEHTVVRALHETIGYPDKLYPDSSWIKTLNI